MSILAVPEALMNKYWKLKLDVMWAVRSVVLNWMPLVAGFRIN